MTKNNTLKVYINVKAKMLTILLKMSLNLKVFGVFKVLAR